MSTCRHFPKRATELHRSLRRRQAPPDPSKAEVCAEPPVAAVCLTCGELSFSQSAFENHGQKNGHHVFIALDSMQCLCTSCRGTKRRGNRWGATEVEPDSKAEPLVEKVEEWKAKNDYRLIYSSTSGAAAAAASPSSSSSSENNNTFGEVALKSEVPHKSKKEKKKKLSVVLNAIDEIGMDLENVKIEVNNEQGEESAFTKGKKRELKGGCLHGIANIGNSCFLNSVLQVLSHAPCLHQRVKQVVNAAEQLGDSEVDVGFTEAFLEIVEAVQSGEVSTDKRQQRKDKGSAKKLSNGKVHPRKFLGYITSKAPQLSGYRQHDAHELLVEVLRGLEEDEILLSKALPVEKDGFSYVRDLFSSEVEKLVSCCHCGNASTSVEENVLVSVNISGGKNKAFVSLEQCIRKSFAPTKLLASEGNGLECERCSSLHESSDSASLELVSTSSNEDRAVGAEDSSAQHHSLDAADSFDEVDMDEKKPSQGFPQDDQPAIGFDEREQGLLEEDEEEEEEEKEKDSEAGKPLKRDAQLSERLSRAPKILVYHLKRFQTRFVKGRVVTEKVCDLVKIPEQHELAISEERVSYELFGVVAHRGSSLNRGHYICFVKPWVSESVRESWWFASDSKVFPVDDSRQVLEDEGCYLAFYEKKSFVE